MPIPSVQEVAIMSGQTTMGKNIRRPVPVKQQIGGLVIAAMGWVAAHNSINN
jgi:hypothetical protein